MNKVYQLFRITSLMTGLTRLKHTIKETNFIKTLQLQPCATVSRSNLFSFCPCCLFYFFILACVFLSFFLGFLWHFYFLLGFFSLFCPFHVCHLSSRWLPFLPVIQLSFALPSFLLGKSSSVSFQSSDKHFFLVSSFSYNWTFILVSSFSSN